jgi:hypothetical protein
MLQILALLFWSGSSYAQTSETALAIYQQDRQIELIESIRPFVKRHQLSQLLVLKDVSLDTKTYISKYGLRHFETFQQYLNFVSTYLTKRDFLLELGKVGKVKPYLVELDEINKAIRKEIGFDGIALRRTALIYTKIIGLSQKLMDGNIDENLRSQLVDLIPQLGEAVSTAHGGDQLKETYEAGHAVYASIVKIYPLLDAVRADHPLFETAQLIKGWNEDYSKYVHLKLTDLLP